MTRVNQQTLVEPAWYDAASFRRLDAPASFENWLKDDGSLTSKLINACSPEGFKVRLLSQQWQRPLYSEQQILGMRQGENALIREVRLLCHDVAWVFARTLIPSSSLTGKARRLANLGNRPLGAVLFSDPSTQRESMQFARLLPGQKLYHRASEGMDLEQEVLWGRRTLFFYAQQPLLVNEIFLPQIVEG